MKRFFTVGPAALHPKLNTYVKEFLDKQYGSISHRSSEFKKIYEHTDLQLRKLMNIPSASSIIFLGSASETWEKIILSCVEHESFHLVNGSFSNKFRDYAETLKKHVTSFSKPLGEGFQFSEINVPEYAELIACTQNETSTGVQMREADIHKLKRANANKIVAVDIVSSAPYPNLDLNLIDSCFFSVQKSFGLPAGLGVWVANEFCLEKAKKLSKKENYISGAHHSLTSLWDLSRGFQTAVTPNVLSIFLLGKVAEDFNNTGIDNLRKQTDNKAKKMYSYFENHPLFEPFVKNEKLRSKTVLVIDCKIPSATIINKLSEKGFVIGAGYGKNKDSQIRISNFMANTEEDIENLLHHFSELF